MALLLCTSLVLVALNFHEQLVVEPIQRCGSLSVDLGRETSRTVFKNRSTTVWIILQWMHRLQFLTHCGYCRAAKRRSHCSLVLLGVAGRRVKAASKILPHKGWSVIYMSSADKIFFVFRFVPLNWFEVLRIFRRTAVAHRVESCCVNWSQI